MIEKIRALFQFRSDDTPRAASVGALLVPARKRLPVRHASRECGDNPTHGEKSDEFPSTHHPADETIILIHDSLPACASSDVGINIRSSRLEICVTRMK